MPDDNRMTITNLRIVRLAMNVSPLAHRTNEILKKAKLESIAMVMRRRKSEWFWKEEMKQEMKMEETQGRAIEEEDPPW